jgi:hypothetical protein
MSDKIKETQIQIEVKRLIELIKNKFEKFNHSLNSLMETIIYQLEQIFNFNFIQEEATDKSFITSTELEKIKISEPKIKQTYIEKEVTAPPQKEEKILFGEQKIDALLSQLKKINLEITQWEYDKELGYVSDREADQMIVVLEKRKGEVQTKLRQLGYY